MVFKYILINSKNQNLNKCIFKGKKGDDSFFIKMLSIFFGAP